MPSNVAASSSHDAAQMINTPGYPAVDLLVTAASA